jgi:hypothetical protein
VAPQRGEKRQPRRAAAARRQRGGPSCILRARCALETGWEHLWSSAPATAASVMPSICTAATAVSPRALASLFKLCVTIIRHILSIAIYTKVKRISASAKIYGRRYR